MKPLEPRFQYEKDLIENAMAVQHCIPREVKEYLAHFIKNALTGLIYHCKICKDRECQELLNKINATLLTINI